MTFAEYLKTANTINPIVLINVAEERLNVTKDWSNKRVVDSWVEGNTTIIKIEDRR